MKDPLFSNKLAFCALAALLLVVGLPVVSESFFGDHGGGHGKAHADNGDHGEEQLYAFPQYPVDIDLGGAGVVKVVKKVDLGTMMASADNSRGQRAVAACAACHSFNEGGANLQGPNLWNIVGRPIAGLASYTNYSSALKEKGGVWTYEALSELLYNSQEYAPGTVMQQKIKKDGKRADILAYLGSLSTDPVPFPKPAQIEVGDSDAETATDPAGE